MIRGWTSRDLDVVCDDDNLWTVTEAAQHLGPLPDDPEDTPVAVTTAKLRNLTRCPQLTGLVPVGKRRSSRDGQPGRYARVYRAGDFIALYERMEHPLAVAA
jgi:hypothetical protein